MTAQSPTSAASGSAASRFVRNVGWVFSSQTIVGICGLVSMAAAARALGAEGVAVVALVEAYMRLTALFIHLEPWQAVIRFGSEAMEHGDTRRLRTLIAFSTLIDLTLGLASAVVAFALASLAAPLLGLEDATGLLYLAAAGLAVSFRPTGIALLRLFDRFDVLARLDAATAAARALLTVLAAASGAGPVAFVLIVVGFSVADGTLAYILGRREMKRRLPPGSADGPRKALQENPGLLRMFFNSNFSVMLRQSTQRLDVMLLATLATPQAVGFYHIARRSAEAAIRLGRPLAQAIYPELARFAAARDTGGLGRFLFGVSSVFVLLLALVVLPVLYWIEPLVVLAFGESFRNAAQVVSLQVAAAAVLLAGVGVVPAMLSLDRDVSLVLLRLVVTGLFFALFWPLATRFGAEGAAAAHLVCNMVWLFAAALILRTTLARRPGGTP